MENDKERPAILISGRGRYYHCRPIKWESAYGPSETDVLTKYTNCEPWYDIEIIRDTWDYERAHVGENDLNPTYIKITDNKCTETLLTKKERLILAPKSVQTNDLLLTGHNNDYELKEYDIVSDTTTIYEVRKIRSFRGRSE